MAGKGGLTDRIGSTTNNCQGDTVIDFQWQFWVNIHFNQFWDWELRRRQKHSEGQSVGFTNIMFLEHKKKQLGI